MYYDVGIVADEGEWSCAGGTEVGHFKVVHPSVSIVEGPEGGICCQDRLVVCWKTVLDDDIVKVRKTYDTCGVRRRLDIGI